MTETEALARIRAVVDNAYPDLLRYTNSMVQLAGRVSCILDQVEPTDWQQRALAAEAEVGLLRAQLRERPEQPLGGYDLDVFA